MWTPAGCLHAGYLAAGGSSRVRKPIGSTDGIMPGSPLNVLASSSVTRSTRSTYTRIHISITLRDKKSATLIQRYNTIDDNRSTWIILQDRVELSTGMTRSGSILSSTKTVPMVNGFRGREAGQREKVRGTKEGGGGGGGKYLAASCLVPLPGQAGYMSTLRYSSLHPRRVCGCAVQGPVEAGGPPCF